MLFFIISLGPLFFQIKKFFDSQQIVHCWFPGEKKVINIQEKIIPLYMSFFDIQYWRINAPGESFSTEGP